MSLVDAKSLAEEGFVGGPGGPGIQGLDHGMGGFPEEQTLSLIARPAFGGTELRQQRRFIHRREVRLHHGRGAFRADAPDAAMRLVALRVAVAGLVMADDRVVKVAHVDRAVGPLTHVHRAEGVVRRTEQHGQLRGSEAGAVVEDAVQFHFARHEAGDDGAALRVVGQGL